MELHLESLKHFYDYLSETGKAIDIFRIIITANLGMKLSRSIAYWNLEREEAINVRIL